MIRRKKVTVLYSTELMLLENMMLVYTGINQYHKQIMSVYLSHSTA